MRGRFAEWTSTIDLDLLHTASTPTAWMSMTVVVGAIVAAAGFLPGARELFALDTSLAAATYVPALVVGVGGGVLWSRGSISAPTVLLIALFDVALLHFFTWSLVLHSRLPGAILMAGFPLSAGALHGHVYKASPRYPYVFVPVALAAAAAAWVAPTQEHRWILAVGGPGVVGLTFLFGLVSTGHHQRQLENESLRAAIQAQILAERARKVEALNEALLAVRAKSHDARTTLSSVIINAQALIRQVEARTGSAEFASDPISEDLQAGLEQLQVLLGEARRLGLEDGDDVEEFDAVPVLRRVLAEAGRRYPDMQLELEDTPASLRVGMRGGQLSLHRMVTNLVQNACEGDGARKATRVQVRLEASTPLVCLSVLDDGPGFSAEVLDRRGSWLHTTKPHGTGLGLYTVERLARANRGTLTLSNRAEGGAMATIHVQASSA